LKKSQSSRIARELPPFGSGSSHSQVRPEKRNLSLLEVPEENSASAKATHAETPSLKKETPPDFSGGVLTALETERKPDSGTLLRLLNRGRTMFPRDR
jgi:hypothetical protein